MSDGIAISTIFHVPFFRDPPEKHCANCAHSQALAMLTLRCVNLESEHHDQPVEADSVCPLWKESHG